MVLKSISFNANPHQHGLEGLQNTPEYFADRNNGSTLLKPLVDNPKRLAVQSLS
jgi:hypothetical protein